MSKEEFNKEWINLSQQMQRLERKRRELYDEYKKNFGSIDLKTDVVPSVSFKHDLDRVDISEKSYEDIKISTKKS